MGSHKNYAPRASEALAGIRRTFILLQRNFPSDRFPRVAFQLSAMDPLIKKLVELFPSNVAEMQELLGAIAFKTKSELAAELEQPESKPLTSAAVDFLPIEIIEDKHYIPKKILWEANRCYDAGCYNACAALLRRLIETLIIGAFEHHKIGDKIKKDGEYIEFGALIGRASAETTLNLGRETKRVLPDLKYFGDVGAHSRMMLVRRPDLDRLHNQVRGAVEELARNL
ncbi:MAG: hypothetical protein M1453_05815 [Acidobacteria bacterium]|nr:hypothetical protein [Acidobacteriota bacterium]MCL5287494.1 hypothetical protein [Acidobacteriota bacterium]